LIASPDGVVEDPTQAEERKFTLLEIKCPYSGERIMPEVTSFAVP